MRAAAIIRKFTGRRQEGVLIELKPQEHEFGIQLLPNPKFKIITDPKPTFRHNWPDTYTNHFTVLKIRCRAIRAWGPLQ
jgi:hypothetical protein